MRGNGCSPCCGAEPTLRVVEPSGVIEFQCARCTRKGGRAQLYEEAALAWEFSRARAARLSPGGFTPGTSEEPEEQTETDTQQ